MRNRLAASVLAVVLGAAVVVACGGGSSSKSSTTTKRTTTASTVSQAGACAQAIQLTQPLSSAASTNDVNTILQTAQSAIPRLRSLAQQTGVSGATQAALKNLANALQMVVNGARGPDSGAAISSAAAQLGDACA